MFGLSDRSTNFLIKRMLRYKFNGSFDFLRSFINHSRNSDNICYIQLQTLAVLLNAKRIIFRFIFSFKVFSINELTP